MKKEYVIQIIQENMHYIITQFNVERLAIFGSAMRDELSPTSDIDILVTFNNHTTLEQYFGLKFFLENMLGYPVDLATDKMLKPSFKNTIENTLYYVA